MTDRERSNVTWFVKILDEAHREMMLRKGDEAEPFMRLYLMAFEAIDRPNDAQLTAYREGRFAHDTARKC